MTEISKTDRKYVLWGRNSEGVIDAIPKDSAEKLYEYIHQKINKEKESNKNNNKDDTVSLVDPMIILKTRYVKGEITYDEFNEMKQNLE